MFVWTGQVGQESIHLLPFSSHQRNPRPPRHRTSDLLIHRRSESRLWYSLSPRLAFSSRRTYNIASDTEPTTTLLSAPTFFFFGRSASRTPSTFFFFSDTNASKGPVYQPLLRVVCAMTSPTSRSMNPRNRCRSPLKIQTASCLLSVAAVMGVAMMPFPILGAAASPLVAPSLAVTPTASPATSPVVAYFGEDADRQSARNGGWNGQPEGFNAEIMETNDEPTTPSVTYPASPSASPPSPFLLQVDAPIDSPVSWTYPTNSPERRKVKRVASSIGDFSEASSSLSPSAASVSWISNNGFTVHENIASTYSPSAQPVSTSPSSAAFSSSTTAPFSAQASVPAAPTSALPLATPFPRPFDQSLSYSLSTSCVAFLASYLGSEEMLGNASRVSRSRVGKCGRPFGLLMSSSSAWAQM